MKPVAISLSQRSKVKKLPQNIEPVSTILRGLEISLRTNTLRYSLLLL